MNTKDITEESKLKKQLGYKPEITYEDEYDSNASIQDSQQETVVLPTVPPKEDIEDNMGIIDSFLPGLDSSIKDLISNVYVPIKDLWEEIKDEDPTNTKPQIETIIIEKEDTDDSDDIYDEDEDDSIDGMLPPPDIFIDNFDDPIHIIEIEHPKEEVIKGEYVKNLYDIIDFYTERLVEAISNYWVQMGSIVGGKPSDSKKYILKNFNSYNKEDFMSVPTNKKHMADFAVRTEISRKQQVLFLQKMFPVDETLIKLRNFKAAYELRKKYATISPIMQSTKSATDHNALLEASNVTYDDKYDKSYLALYKYLNSSAKKVDDALILMVHEAKAKQYLK